MRTPYIKKCNSLDYELATQGNSYNIYVCETSFQKCKGFFADDQETWESFKRTHPADKTAREKELRMKENGFDPDSPPKCPDPHFIQYSTIIMGVGLLGLIVAVLMVIFKININKYFVSKTNTSFHC